jgi:head-tail adaptor
VKDYAAGDLDRIATIQVKTSVADEMSAEGTEEWAEYAADVPCAVEYAGSREFPASVKRVAESTVRFVFRYRSDIDPATMRIVYVEDHDASPTREQVFDIFPPQHIGRRDFTAVEAKESQ